MITPVRKKIAVLSVKNMSFKSKLLLYATMTTATALVLCGVAVITGQWIEARHELPRDLGIQADVIGANTSAALSFDDPKDARETLRDLRANENIVFARVDSADGREFATFLRPDAKDVAQEQVPPGGYRFVGNRLHLKRPILLNGEQIGTIYLQYDLKQFYDDLTRTAATLVMGVLIALAGATLVSTNMQRVLTRPITELANTARVIAQNSDYSVRAVKRSNDELGTLTDTFNEMLSQIERRDLVLQESRQTLEWQVEDRTQALARREQQAEVVAKLGQYALVGNNLDELFNLAVKLLAKALDVEYAKVLELSPDGKSLRLRAGVGWTEGLVGNATVGTDHDSQAGYTLLSDEPVVVENLRTEKRFNGPPLLLNHGVLSGMSTVIQGNDRPFGVLGVHSTSQRVFLRDDVRFLESVATVLAEATHRTRAEEIISATNGQLETIRRALLQFLGGSNVGACLNELLEGVCELTHSEYGFIGEILEDEDGTRYLKMHAWTDISWDRESRRLYQQALSTGFEFRNLKTLFGAVVATGKIVIANDAANDPRSGGVPQGHPPMQNFMGLPFSCGEAVNGMVGIANRSRGYCEQLAESLEPFLVTCANLVRAHRMEARRREAELQLETARREAVVANRAKSEFLANMSHEIRTPLTAIMGYADIILEDGDLENAPPQRVDAAQTIQRNSTHLLELVNDILDLSKIEAGELQTECIACSPCDMLADVLSLMRVRAQKADLKLSVDYRGPLPETIQTDPTRLRQILINLVGNAIKFTKQGSVDISVRLVDDGAVHPQLCFDIADTGIGMSDDQMQSIFDPFTQADTSTTRKYGGTGLGLAISRQMARLLGGDIVCRSELGKGSTFRVTVATGALDGVKMVDPRGEAIAHGETTDETSAAPALSTSKKDLDCRILLVEDGPDNQRLISFILEKSGAQVTVADNGKIGVDSVVQATNTGDPFDIVLMDMQMPVMDGYEATRELRRQGFEVPIIALTAHAMADDREKCLDAGCNDYATKPINRASLIELIQSYLSKGDTNVPTDKKVAAPIVSELSDPDMTDLVEMFVQELPDKIAALQQATSDQDLTQLAGLAHQLKGAAGGYGFPSITDAAKALETRARANDDFDAIATSLQDLADLCGRARAGSASA